MCHRPSNCNSSNLCGLYKSLAPEIVSWLALQEFSARNCELASRNLLRLRRKARCARLSPPADSRAFGARASGARFWSQLPRIESLTKTSRKQKHYINKHDKPRGDLVLCAL